MRAMTRLRHGRRPAARHQPGALGKLKPAFALKGAVTAGNSSQTSDGAAAVLVMERGRAEALGLKPLARLVWFAVGGVRAGGHGHRAHRRHAQGAEAAGLELKDIDLIELNEAFAAQALAVVRELEMDEERVNVNGGAIALGHPLGCTGAKLTVQMIHEMQRQRQGDAAWSPCASAAVWARRGSFS